MEKPIVFLSHSSKDKRPLLALKELLDGKAVGFLNFFLSSDGQSIALGENWVHRLNEALRSAKLMFVFLSKEALQSEWILFEAGYAHARGIHVVPCCLPGTQIKDLPAPLKLLQAQPLHCAKDLSGVVKKCNEVFGTKIPETVTSKEFASVFRQFESPEEKTKPAAWELLLSDIVVTAKGPPGGADTFLRLCRRRHLDCFGDRSSSPATWRELTSSGVTLREESEWFDERRREHVASEAEHRYSITLSPELFGLTSNLIDSWAKKGRSGMFYEAVEASFVYGVLLESTPHELTTKLFDSGIRALDSNWFLFRDLRFSLTRPGTDWSRRPVHPHLQLHFVRRLSQIPLPDLLSLLLERHVLMLETKELARRVFAGKQR